MVGDPSGRSEERNLLDAEALRHNVECIERAAAPPDRLRAGSDAGDDWSTTPTGPSRCGVLDFLRDVGKYVSVNTMLTKDSVRNRLEDGLSFTEFSYSLLQANDFRHLYEHEGVELQGGGSDQWGNIVAGVDLIRRRLGAGGARDHAPAGHEQRRIEVRQDGRRCRVARSGEDVAVPVQPVLDPGRRCDGTDVPADVVDACAGGDRRPASPSAAAAPEQRITPTRHCREEMTVMVHGAGAADAAEEAARMLFGGDPTDATPSRPSSSSPTRSARSSATSPALADPVETLVAAGLAASKGDARRGLAQRELPRQRRRRSPRTPRSPTSHRCTGAISLLRRGKKTHRLVRLP